jgi:4-hydroxybenzoate polyprenyltransferase
LGAVARRHNLTGNGEKRLLISGGLVVLFLITNATLPYPQSLYWFIFLSVLLTSVVLCRDILKIETSRFKNLKVKDRIMNIVFCGHFIIITHISL